MEKKSYHQNKNLVLVILIIASGILASFIICRQKTTWPYFESYFSSPAQPDDSLIFDLTAEYQMNLAYQIKHFQTLTKDQSYFKNISEIKNNLLFLKVPSQYKSLHLDLILAFASLEKSLQENTSLQIKQAEIKIEHILKNNNWLLIYDP